MRKTALIALVSACLAMVPGAPAGQSRRFSEQLSKTDKISHALNRLTFGPRPGDAERLRAKGLKRWIDLELHPERIAENPVLEARFATLESLALSSAELVQNYRPSQQAAGSGAVRPDRTPQTASRELMEAKLLRAVYSNRQLKEVLVDFWYNHFNVFLDKGADRYLVSGYERDVIRPRVLGRFRDLLEATARSPAMLFYLDNWQSAGANSAAANRPRRGLNENYGRELLELHTLGVDGGYTQKDVTEVARCFTGWTIDQPRRGGGFVFNPRLHDSGEKVVLGVTIPAGGGIEDGLKVIDILGRHPSTARFLSWKLARHFVADDPPPSLVGRMARAFLKSGGDLREVMKTMLESKEFWSQDAYRSKIKSPFEMVVSALRASEADIGQASALANQVAQIGEPLYRKAEPTGYPDFSREWINSAGLLARMNFALQLANNRMPGVKLGRAVTPVEFGSPEFQRK